ncbi:clusterin-associated protein 1 isoform X2 [Pieris rapae]|uniref:clusterin-associated protein 1 isoform X2 n=1 Tax=Pieris rapae TaxID=64459 RepID=UPI001E27B4F8|nr:clusterin-associated protein 1 isoform X2 [Pieris rapae]
MRVLGFPEHISMESFRTPNWDLLDSCLRWLAARLEPDAVLAGGKDTMERRVAMVMHAVEIFHSRANLKLNGKKVYGADGWAVRELLKVAALLRTALETPPPSDRPDHVPLLYDVTSRIGEIKQARSLATDITAQGAYLHDLLAKEPENKASPITIVEFSIFRSIISIPLVGQESRSRALSRPLDTSATEAALRRASAVVAERVAATREAAEAAAGSEAALVAKAERRRAELQRAEKRLRTVQKIKPVYQAELTALETEIEQLWDQYVVRYRCVEALKHQLSLLEMAQNESAEEQQASILQLIHKYEAEDVLGKLSDSDEMNSSEGERETKPRAASRPRTRLRIKTAGNTIPENRGVWAGRDSLDIRDEDDSDTDSDPDVSDTQLFGAAGGSGRAARWSRRPGTRTLTHEGHYADLGLGLERKLVGPEDGDSLGSSSESELRLSSPKLGRNSALSDNEF